jgi:hypothetical protein
MMFELPSSAFAAEIIRLYMYISMVPGFNSQMLIISACMPYVGFRFDDAIIPFINSN